LSSIKKTGCTRSHRQMSRSAFSFSSDI